MFTEEDFEKLLEDEEDFKVEEPDEEPEGEEPEKAKEEEQSDRDRTPVSGPNPQDQEGAEGEPHAPRPPAGKATSPRCSSTFIDEQSR